jgi:hypothetical protein
MISPILMKSCGAIEIVEQEEAVTMAQQKLMTRRRYIDPVPSAEADGFTEVSLRRGSAPANNGKGGHDLRFCNHEEKVSIWYVLTKWKDGVKKLLRSERKIY